MEANNDNNTEIVLHEWRTKILNGFLIVVAILALSSLIPIFIKAYKDPSSLGRNLFFIIAALIIVAIAIFRRINISLRVSLFLLIGYVTAIVNMYYTGLTGRGFSYFIVLPAIALVFIGKRAGLLTSILSTFIVATFTTLFVNNLYIPPLKTHPDPWMNFAAMVLLLVSEMSLLILFYRFQEQIISKQRSIQTELLLAQNLLEDQNATLLEGTQALLVSVDTNGYFTYANDAMAEAVGYKSHEEVIGKSYLQFVHPEDRQRVLAAYDNQIKSCQPSTIQEFRVIDSTGGVKWFSFLSTLIIKDGNIIGQTGVAQNVTDHKLAEELLRQSEKQYRLIAENSDDVIWTTDTELHFTYVSPSTTKLRGVTVEEAMNAKVEEIMTPESLNKVLAEYSRFLPEIEQGKNPSVRVELEEYRKDGSTLWVDVSMKPMRDAEGSLIGYLGVTRDISERKHMEALRDETAMMLRRSEEQYRLIAENSDDVIFTLDPELRFTYMSPSSFKLRGVTAEDAMNERLEDIMTLESLNRVIAEYGRVLAEIEKGDNPTVRIEIEQYRKDRSTLWVDISIRTMRDANGRHIGFLGVSRDISERKKQEEALHESESKYRFLIENSNDIVWTFDLKKMAYSFCSNSITPILGYSTEESVGMTLDDIFSPETKNILITAFGKMIGRNATTDRVLIEAEHIARDGHKVWMEINAVVQKDKTGKVVLMNGMSRDISERKRVEEILRASEEKFRQIVNSIPYVVSMLDMNLRFTYISTGVQRILGYTVEEAMMLSMDQIFTPKSLTIVGKSFQERLEANAKGSDSDYVLTLELEQYHKNGSTVVLESAMTFLRNANGAPVNILSVSTDITERREAEARLKEAKEAAEAANRSKSMFLANMSHEIRTPMNAILGFAQLMQRDQSLTPQLRDNLDIINRSGEHLLVTINDILEMSKIEAGRSVFSPSTFDLHTLLYNMERMFRLRTDGKNLRFLVEKVGHIPQWVKTDEGKLRQVLINLLGNAAKFTEEGGIVLRVGGKAGNSDTVNLQFEVEDTGPGISQEEIEKLFRAFEQTRSGIKSGGTGLGLALSRGFAQILGGDISVNSTLGKGSIFRFNIPVQEDIEANAAKKVSKQQVQHLKPGQEEIRILIVDDRETNRKLLLRLLSSVGFTTNHASDGKEAISMVSKWKPHLVLMDMAMPVMDGYEATRKIKESPDIRHTAIVAVTASAFEEDKQRILAAGADGYLSKPFKDAELFETIGQLTGAQYLYEETSALKVSETADDKALMRKTVATLPTDLVNRMRNAVQSADLDLLNELAEKLVLNHPTLAKQIQEMAAKYEYEALTKLFSSGV